jgi:hypothetical protein
MQGGRDEGFCLYYWALSYRRKFIRSLCTFVLCVAAAPLMLFVPYLTHPVLLFEIFVAISAVTLSYTFRKWQSEVRTETFHPPT